MLIKFVGYFFFLLCPFVGGAFIPIFILPTEYIGVGMFIYTLVWCILFSSWFDGSKYQKAL